MLIHGVVGCVTTAASGGKCGAGALSAAASEALNGNMPKGLDNNVYLATAARALAGGVASKLGGGTFANGAETGAFSYLFNQVAHASSQPVVASGRPLTPGEIDAALAEFPTLKTDSIRIAYDISNDAAYTPYNTIHFPSDMATCTDFSTCSNGAYVGWFEHEVTHVWQYQNDVSPFWGHIFSSSVFQFGDYLPLSQYVKTPSDAGLNTEQQADWHKWHYLCTHGLQQGC